MSDKTEFLLTKSISSRQVMRIKKNIYFRGVLIHYRIHRGSIIKIPWQTIRRITHVILGVKVQYNGVDLTKYS